MTGAVASASASLPMRVYLGDTIACDVRHPVPDTLAMRLDTPAAVAYANKLLRDPAKSSQGWRVLRRADQAAVVTERQATA